jgi:acyl dehydratase
MYFEDYFIGQKFYPEPVTITGEDITEFAQKYDSLPLHLDPEHARNSRFGGIIASGWHTLCSFWGQFVKLGIGGTEVLAGIGVDYLNWTAPVYPGDRIMGEVEVMDLIPSSKGGQGVLVLRASAFNQDGTAVMELQVKSIIQSRNGPNPVTE